MVPQSWNETANLGKETRNISLQLCPNHLDLFSIMYGEKEGEGGKHVQGVGSFCNWTSFERPIQWAGYNGKRRNAARCPKLKGGYRKTMPGSWFQIAGSAAITTGSESNCYHSALGIFISHQWNFWGQFHNVCAATEHDSLQAATKREQFGKCHRRGLLKEH